MKTSILNTVEAILKDARFYLERISDEAYSMPLPVYGGATIGQHTRHFIEFFQCLAESLAVASQGDEIIVNYDLRRRDRLIETDPRYALAVINSLSDSLAEATQSTNIWLHFTDYSTGNSTLLRTSVEREMHYNVEHAIHHFALIKIGLNIVMPCLGLPVGFGVAPSTLHRSPAFISQN